MDRPWDNSRFGEQCDPTLFSPVRFHFFENPRFPDYRIVAKLHDANAGTGLYFFERGLILFRDPHFEDAVG